VPLQEPHTGNEGAEPPLLDRESGTADDARPGTGETNTEAADRDHLQSAPAGENGSDGSGDRGRNTEDQRTSTAPEGEETDQFAALPTRADLDPASGGELTRDRGEPLAPINENQDLREPAPERDSDWKKAVRGLNNDIEDAIKSGDDTSVGVLDITEHRPPTDYPTGTRDTGPQIRNLDSSVNIPNAAMGIVAAAMVVFSVVEGIRSAGRRFLRRNDDSYR
jgi:hypothetical protein